MKHASALFVATILALTSTVTRGADTPKAAGTGDCFKGPLGLQLYSLRDQFAKDVPGTLDKVYDFGFRAVELAGNYGKTPEEFSALLAAHHLKAVAGHFGFERFRDDPEGIAKEAKAFGLEWAGTAWVPHKEPLTEEWVHETAKVFNHAGEVLAKHGIKFYYHNHGYEFVPHGDGTLFDLLVQETKPGQVYFEMDVMWTVFPGQNPAQLLAKYGNRWGLMHVKDLRKGVATGSLKGGTDTRNDVVIGSGQTDWVALLGAAQKAGVQYYFIEDESPSVLEQVPQSLKFLESVKF